MIRLYFLHSNKLPGYANHEVAPVQTGVVLKVTVENFVLAERWYRKDQWSF